MKWKKGQVVYSERYGYKYEVLEISEYGYTVRNLTMGGGGRPPFKLVSTEGIEKFETECVPVEILKSPLWKALE